VETNSHQTDVDVFEDHEEYDNYVTAQVLLPRGEQMELATVLRRKRDADGRLIGKYNANPIQDTSEYEVQFSDGTVLEYAANDIAENLYSQVDDEGQLKVMMEDIVVDKKDSSAVTKQHATFAKNGKTRKKLTTKG
jgi:phage baseplate assembly protein gpV